MAHRSSETRINLYPSMRELYDAEQETSIQERENHSFSFSCQRATSFTDLFRSFTESPLKPSDRGTLIAVIKQLLDSGSVPEGYRTNFVMPFYEKLRCNSQAWFDQKLENEVINRVVQSLFQNFGSGDGDIPRANTEALREIISDLYKNFQDEFCTSVAPHACPSFASPVPNWSNEDLSTFSDPKWLCRSLGVNASIVNVPSRYAKAATLAWGCLPHEVAGHDLLAAYPGALNELLGHVKTVLSENRLEHTFKYWERWFEEATSDVLGVLNMGPAAAFALIGFLKTEGEETVYRLSSTGDTDDEHPIDLVRGFLVADAAGSLVFGGAATYAFQLRTLVSEDVRVNNLLEMKTLFKRQKFEQLLYKYYQVDTSIVMFGESLEVVAQRIFNNPQQKRLFIKFLHREGFDLIKRTSKLAVRADGTIEIYHTMRVKYFFKSAWLIAKVIRETKLKVLDDRSFSDIRSWSMRDEKISNYFQKVMSSEDNLWDFDYREGFFAAHVVSAAIMESITERDGEKITRGKLHFVFQKMITILQSMNQANPEWEQPSSTQSEWII